MEFAARGDEANALELLLQTLGFARLGTHIAKDLSLWSQGAIRIVVNHETTGYASSAYTMHGTTVCDVGLAVDDAAATVARAVGLGVQPFS